MIEILIQRPLTFEGLKKGSKISAQKLYISR